MYEAFYELTEKPFSILPDPAYLYLGKRHALAYTMLEYGVEHRAGFTVITGDVGCGKTTLIRHLLNNLEQDVTVGLISNTQKEIGELLKWVLLSFDQPYDATDKVKLFDQLQQFLVAEYAKGKRTVLIIDEAQNLAGETLEELRMLSNINADKDQLLQIVLVGQPQLKQLLGHPELRQFAQRVSSDFHIPQFTVVEVAQYIRHRLEVGGRAEPLFDAAAVHRIAAATKCVPRAINILCDTALIYGFSCEAPRITREIVDEVLADRAKYGVFPGVEPKPEPELKPDIGKVAAGTPGDDAAVNKAVLQRLHAVAGYIQGERPAANTVPTGVPAGLAVVDDTDDDQLFDKAVEVVLRWRRGSVYLLKHQLKISHNRATQLVQQMERAGVLSAPNELGSRKVLKSPDQDDEL